MLISAPTSPRGLADFIHEILIGREVRSSRCFRALIDSLRRHIRIPTVQWIGAIIDPIELPASCAAVDTVSIGIRKASLSDGGSFS